MDEYERNVISPGGHPRHREKAVFKYHWFFAIFVLFALLGTAGAGVAAAAGSLPAFAPLLGILPIAGFLYLWLAFAVLRVHVTHRELVVSAGPIGPRIALDAIVDCEVRPRAHGRFSYGKVRLNADGSVLHSYMLPGLAERLVYVTFTKNGRRHVLELSSRDPDVLAREINAARESAAPRVRADARGERREGDADSATAVESDARRDQADARDQKNTLR